MADPTDFGPGRTPLLGLTYTSDSATNANLDKIDALLGELYQAAHPPAPPPPATKTPPTGPAA
jgi:hypothetical protein